MRVRVFPGLDSLSLLGRWIGSPRAASFIGAGRPDLLLRSSRSLAIRLWPFLVFLPGQLSALRRPFLGPISHDQTKAYKCNPKSQAQLGVESIVVVIRPWPSRPVTEIEQIICGKKWTNNKAYQIRKHPKRCLHAFSSFVRSWCIYAQFLLVLMDMFQLANPKPMGLWAEHPSSKSTRLIIP
jgi:hypothetical protein